MCQLSKYHYTTAAAGPLRTWLRRVWTVPALLLALPLAAAAVNLTSVTVNPPTIVAGSPVEVTIALDSAAPTGGVLVLLSSSDAATINVASAQTVDAGAASKGFNVTQTGAVDAPTQVTITASYGGATRSATVDVMPRSPVRGVAGDLWADVIIGKPDFSEVTPNQVSNRRLFNPGGVLVDRSVRPNRMYVYDAGNSRVLGLSHLGSCAGGISIGQPCTVNSDCSSSTCAIEEGRGADIVLGQPSFTTSACNGDGDFQRFPTRAAASASTLCGIPEAQVSFTEGGSFANMDVDNAGNFYVADWDNNRVLRYNSPFETDTIADDVWGQADFGGKECNRGRGEGFPDNQSLCFRNNRNEGFTGGVAIDSGGNLWITDNSNNRVLRFPFDSATGSPGHVADKVLGQPDFASSARGTTLNHMFAPAAVRVDSAGVAYVADDLNNRVLVFNPPLTSGMTGGKLNYAFREPRGLELNPAGGIWVSDSQNNQLLLFVGGLVQKVLFKGQPDSSGLCGGNYVGDGPPYFSEGDGFFVNSWNACGSYGSIGIDSDGNVFAAVLPYQDVFRFPAPFPAPSPSTSHSGDARIFKAYQWGIDNEAGLSGIDSARGVAVAGSQLIVGDRGRLLFWNNSPNLTNGQPADGFVGAANDHLQQVPAFTRIRADSLRLWALRGATILAYAVPLTTGASPAITIASPLPVLGGGTLTWDDLISIGGVAPDGDKLWVADPTRNRVFRIRNATTAPVADVVLGQTSISGTACNQGHGDNGLTRTSLCQPGAVSLDRQGNIYVSDFALEDTGNYRLLEFDAALFPASPTRALLGVAASRVFGTGGSFTLRPCQGGDTELCTALFEPAFASGGQMVVGRNAYRAYPNLPFLYTNPLVSQRVSALLNDFFSMGYASTFDSNDNLYVADLNRGRVLIYLNPLPALAPATFALNVTKAGGGTGTVKSSPPGVDCGTACSQLFIDGTSVSLSTVPSTNSLFAGWSGDADCSDGIVTMSAARTCTARFDLRPDLIVSVLTVPIGAVAGSTISVTDTTRNQTGTGQAAASTTALYLSTNSIWDAGDTLLGSRAIPALAPGGSSSGATLVTIPFGKATGNYFIIARADAGGALTESNETNNTKSAAIRVSPPDLVVSAISVPTTGGAGLTITATNTTKNQANTGPAPASTTKFYLSANSTLDGGDPLIGFQDVGALNPGASEAHSTSLAIPAGTAKGTYYVIAKADADNLVTETLENNNTASDTIVIGPDLIVSVLTVPSIAQAGQQINVTDTTRNQGGGSAAASTTSYYLSTNSTFGTGDVSLGGRSVGALNPGQSSPGPQTSVTIPAGTAPGNYYIVAVSDDAAVVPETNETNNTIGKTIKINP
jgi:hypothetical protein